MSAKLGSTERPLRVAIVGSGPSGFYAAEAFFKQNIPVEIAMIESLPAPFGLVRYGVAPDHGKIKNVIKVYEKTLQRPEVSFFGNVIVGEDIGIADLNAFFDAIIFSYGAESDRRLNIPGEDLPGSYTATEFVAWYNGHPDYADRVFDLSQERVFVIGQGNVAMDVSRILCKTVDELKNTDIAQHALDALAESQIKEVHLIGRRGPAQAAFTPVEIKEFAELADCYPVVSEEDLNLNPTSLEELQDPSRSQKKKNYEILQALARQTPEGRSKKFQIHFRMSPKALEGESKVEKVIFEKNRLMGDAGKQKAVGSGEMLEFDGGLVFRSVGYRGLAMEGLPFNEDWGVIPNHAGRVGDGESVKSGLYVSGWIKRGPSGIIGTNKPDSEETVYSLLEDLPHLTPCSNPNTDAFVNFLVDHGVNFISYDDWLKIDAAEIANGEKAGKPREKFVTREEMLKAAGK